MPFSADVFDVNLENGGVVDCPVDIGFAFFLKIRTVFFDEPLQGETRILRPSDAAKNDAAFECGRKLFGMYFGIPDNGKTYLGIAFKFKKFFTAILNPVEVESLSVKGEV